MMSEFQFLHSDDFRALSLRACILSSNIDKICKSLNSVKMSASFALIYVSNVCFKRDWCLALRHDFPYFELRRASCHFIVFFHLGHVSAVIRPF